MVQSHQLKKGIKATEISATFSNALSIRSLFTVTPGSEQIRATIERDEVVRYYFPKLD